MLSIFKKYSYNKHLKNILADSKSIHHQKINLNECKSVGILFDATEEYSFTSVEHFADRLKKNDVEFLGFINQQKKKINAENIPFSFFSANDVAWNYVPQSELVDKFMNRQFDLLLNLTVDQNYTLEYIMAGCRACFRVGAFHDNKNFCYDFMLNLKPTDKLPELIKQIETYLPMFNDNK
jgi:hypothetical protein